MVVRSSGLDSAAADEATAVIEAGAAAAGINDGGDGSDADVFPAILPPTARVRDVLARADIGTIAGGMLNVQVPPHDARMLRVFPISAAL